MDFAHSTIPGETPSPGQARLQTGRSDYCGRHHRGTRKSLPRSGRKEWWEPHQQGTVHAVGLSSPRCAAEVDHQLPWRYRRHRLGWNVRRSEVGISLREHFELRKSWMDREET